MSNPTTIFFTAWRSMGWLLLLPWVVGLVVSQNLLHCDSTRHTFGLGYHNFESLRPRKRSGVWWFVMTVSMYVCMSVYLYSYMSIILCASYIWSWLVPSLATLRDVMYFRFCRCRRICSSLDRQNDANRGSTKNYWPGISSGPRAECDV